MLQPGAIMQFLLTQAAPRGRRLHGDDPRQADGRVHLLLLRDRPRDARHHLLRRPQDEDLVRVLRGRPLRLGAPERLRPRRRLHVRRLVPRHLRHGRAEGLRRHDLRDRLARRLARAHVPRRRAAPEPRQVHLRGRRRLPPAPAAGPHRRGHRRHPDGALLHDRPDGRLGLAHPAHVRPQVRVRRDHRRRRDARLRALRRHARDDLGPDHQGRPAPLRRDPPHRRSP